MKGLLLLLALSFSAHATTNPPYYGVSGPSNGTVTQYISGKTKIAASSTTADTTQITLDGTTGNVTLTGALNLPLSTSGVGAVYSGTNTFIHSNTGALQLLGINFFAGVGAGPLTLSSNSSGGTGDVGVGHFVMQSCLADTVNACIRNTGVGTFALQANTRGYSNTAIGTEAMQFTTTGNQNAAVGDEALANNVTGSSNTALGSGALFYNTTGGNNTAVGFAAGGSFVAGSASANTSVGASALANVTTGGNNTCVGFACLTSLTTGTNNTTVGENTLLNLTTGASNTAIGMQSLQNNTANSNTAVGYQSSQANTTGTNNVSNGYLSQNSNTVGSNNTSVGVQSLQSNTSGNSNTAIGDLAGYTAVSANANVSGSSNTWVGYDSGPGTATQLNGSTCIGNSCRVNVSSAIVLGGAGVSVGIATPSPAPTNKLEVNGQTNVAGSTFTTSGLQLINISSTAASTTAGVMSYDQKANILNIGNGSTISSFTAGGSQSWIPVFGGFSSSPTVSATYFLMGKICYFHVEPTVIGISSATNFTITLPFVPANTQTNIVSSGVSIDNGSTQTTAIRGDIYSGTNVMLLYKGLNAAAWTGSGNKYAYVHGWFEVQ